jgi:hypothetical protein
MTTTSPIWLGKAFCTVAAESDQFRSGHRGAIVVFACQAIDVCECCRQISSELAENGLNLKGFEYLMDHAHIDREISTYEKELIDRLGSYPVQFENVHYFKGDA